MNRERFKALFPRASEDTVKANTESTWEANVKYKKGDVLYDARSGEYVKILDDTHETDPDPKLQNTELERDKAAALGATIQGKTEGIQRVKVRFIGYRCRPLDPDNFAGGCKDLLDGLRHSGLIPDDAPWRIIFETEQVKVDHRSEERTQIVLEYL